MNVTIEQLQIVADELKAQNEALRAELTAERERARRLEADGLAKYERIHLLEAERDALRAELAAERDLRRLANRKFDKAEAECDKLRVLLARARDWIVSGKVDFNDALADDINVALKGKHQCQQ